MQRVHIGIIGAGPQVEWALLPVLTGPDAMSPPDSGAWWSRRPISGGDIRYQPPVTPEVVALCDPSSGGSTLRVAALARASRIPSVYTDWRLMVREVPLDAIFIAGGDEPSGGLAARPDPGEVVRALATAPPSPCGTRWVWADGPGARNSAGLDGLHRALAGRYVNFWQAHPMRFAAAHRAASRLVERGAIGNLCAFQGRWPLPFDEAHMYGNCAAIDLMLAFYGGLHGARVVAGRHPDGVTNVWVHLSSGVTATHLFSPADSWNSPWPRFEVVGSEGRSLICEGGRKVTHYVPREGARYWEPPGLATHVSSANVAGVGEDIKAFLARLSQSNPWDNDLVLRDAAHTLALWEAIRNSLDHGKEERVEVRSPGSTPLPGALGPLQEPTLTLNL